MPVIVVDVPPYVHLRHVPTGRGKGVCNRVRAWGGVGAATGATKRGFEPFVF